MPGAAGGGLADPAPPEPVPASEPPLEPADDPDELAPAPVPTAPDDPVLAPDPDPEAEDVAGAGLPLLPPGVDVAPEEPCAALAPAPLELELETSVPGPSLSPEDPGVFPPEQATGPMSANKGSNERRCRRVAMVVLAFRVCAPPLCDLAFLCLSRCWLSGRGLQTISSRSVHFIGGLDSNVGTEILGQRFERIFRSWKARTSGSRSAEERLSRGWPGKWGQAPAVRETVKHPNLGAKANREYEVSTPIRFANSSWMEEAIVTAREVRLNRPWRSSRAKRRKASRGWTLRFGLAQWP